jgi:hypothetical protein
MTHAAILAADVCKEMVGKPWGKPKQCIKKQVFIIIVWLETCFVTSF